MRRAADCGRATRGKTRASRWAAIWRWRSGSWATPIRQSAQLRKPSGWRRGLAFWKAVAALSRSCGLLLLQRPAEALEQTRQALTLFRSTGAEISLAHYH